MRPLIRASLLVLGTLCVALGVVGMFVPILPTTPFLLLAAACYARSSDRFLHWLLYNRWFGAYIRNYREGRGMPAATKTLTLLALWLTLALSASFATSSWWIRLLLLAVGLGVTVHLMSIPTYRNTTENDSRNVVQVTPSTSEEP